MGKMEHNELTASTLDRPASRGTGREPNAITVSWHRLPARSETIDLPSDPEPEIWYGPIVLGTLAVIIAGAGLLAGILYYLGR
jgi:hypothetical protein